MMPYRTELKHIGAIAIAVVFVVAVVARLIWGAVEMVFQFVVGGG